MSSNIQIQRICQHCGNEFTARTTVTKYCSQKCNSRAGKARVRALKVGASNSETQQIKLNPIEEIKAKPFLSIAETCKLIGVSRRTVYRMLDCGDLIAGKAGSHTLIRRADIDNLFEQHGPGTSQEDPSPEPVKYEIENCYSIGEAQLKFGISEKTFFELVKRNKISKFQKGKFVYVPKPLIDNLLR